MLLPFVLYFMLRLIEQERFDGQAHELAVVQCDCVGDGCDCGRVVAGDVLAGGCAQVGFWRELEELAVGEVADEGEVGGQEVEVGKRGEGTPLHFCEDAVLEFAGEFEDAKELDFDGAAVAVSVAEGGDAVGDDGFDAKFFVEFAGEGEFGGFAKLDFAAGELPLEAHGLVGAALADEDFAGGRVVAAQNERGHDMTQRLGGGLWSASVELADRLLHVLPV